MGSLSSKIKEEQEEIIFLHKKAQLQNISEFIRDLQVDGESYQMVDYLWRNRDKIYRNRKLIDLIA